MRVIEVMDEKNTWFYADDGTDWWRMSYCRNDDQENTTEACKRVKMDRKRFAELVVDYPGYTVIDHGRLSAEVIEVIAQTRNESM
jgi:hypothetical protein